MGRLNQEQHDRFIYNRAREYLLSQNIPAVSPALLDKTLELPSALDQIESIPEIYERLLISAPNANMKVGVMGGSIGGVERLAALLEDFEPTAVVAKQDDDWQALLDNIVSQLQPRGQIRRTSRTIWPQYCKSVLLSAAFMA